MFNDFFGIDVPTKPCVLTRPEGHVLRFVLLGRCFANIFCQCILDWIARHIVLMPFHISDKFILDTPCWLPAKCGCHHWLILCTIQYGVFMLLLRTTFRTCHKGCTHLHTLCSECKRSPHTACIHNPSGCDDWNAHMICGLGDKRHRANHSLFKWNGKCSAMSSSFTSLHNNHIHPVFFIHYCFFYGCCSSD